MTGSIPEPEFPLSLAEAQKLRRFLLNFGTEFAHADCVPEEVNHPDHYGGADNPYEVIKVLEAWKLNFHLGNAVKYIARAGRKETSSELTDLRKAGWYLKRHLLVYNNYEGDSEIRDALECVQKRIAELSE